jgi:methyl-accepting chemotaxis protein
VSARSRLWGARASAAFAAFAAGLSAAAATPASLGGQTGPLAVSLLVVFPVLLGAPRRWAPPLAWVVICAAAAAPGWLQPIVAARLVLCGLAGSVLWVAFSTRLSPLKQTALAAVGSVALVVDGAIGPRLGVYAGHGASVALATSVRLLVMGSLAWLSFRRREVEEDEALARIASYLSGRGAPPSDAPAPLDQLASAAAGIRQRIALERERASRARSRISEVALKVQRESDRYQSGAAEQVGSLSETSVTSEQLLGSARRVSDRVRELSEVAEASLVSARGGVQTAQAFSGTVGSLGEACRSVADHLLKLREAVHRIAASLDGLFRATNKADVLALSAELEASKAEGDEGGEARFASVGKQMREMGEAVQRSMEEIGPLLEEIRQAVQTTARATDLGVSATSRGYALSSSLAERLGTIADMAAVTVESVKEVTSMTDLQIQRTAELDRTLTRLAEATRSRTSASAPMVATGRALEAIASPPPPEPGAAGA